MSEDPVQEEARRLGFCCFAGAIARRGDPCPWHGESDAPAAAENHVHTGFEAAPGETRFEVARANGQAWRATYAAGRAAFQDASESLGLGRVDAAVAEAVLTFLRECPHLERSAHVLAGRTASTVRGYRRK